MRVEGTTGAEIVTYGPEDRGPWLQANLGQEPSPSAEQIVRVVQALDLWPAKVPAALRAEAH